MKDINRREIIKTLLEVFIDLIEKDGRLYDVFNMNDSFLGEELDRIVLSILDIAEIDPDTKRHALLMDMVYNMNINNPHKEKYKVIDELLS